MTFYEAALRVLESEGRPLHFLEITERSIAQNLLSHVGKTPEITMLSRLAAMARRTRDRKVIVTAKDTFALIDWSIPEDAEALAQTGVLEPNPEEELPPLRPPERHPEPRLENVRVAGRGSERKQRRRDEEEAERGGRKRRYPPLPEVVFEILSEAEGPLRTADIIERARDKDLAPEDVSVEAVLTALLEDNQRRIDAGRRPQFAYSAESGEVTLERAGKPSEAPPLELQAAFAAALGIPLEGGRPVLARATAQAGGEALLDPAVLLSARTALKEARRVVARALRKRLSDVDVGTFEKSVVKMMHGLGFRELKVAKRSKEGPLLTARKREGSVELRYAVRLLKGSPSIDRKQVQELRRDLGHYSAQVGLLVSAGDVRGDARSEATASGALVMLWCGDALGEKFLEAKAGVSVTQVELFDIDERFFEIARLDAEEAQRRREERQREKRAGGEEAEETEKSQRKDRAARRKERGAREQAESAEEAVAKGEGEEAEAAPEVEAGEVREAQPPQDAPPPREAAGEEEEGEEDEDEDLEAASAFVGGARPEGAEGERKRRRRRRRGRRGRGRSAEATAQAEAAPEGGAEAAAEGGSAPATEASAESAVEGGVVAPAVEEATTAPVEAEAAAPAEEGTAAPAEAPAEEVAVAPTESAAAAPAEPQTESPAVVSAEPAAEGESPTPETAPTVAEAAPTADEASAPAASAEEPQSAAAEPASQPPPPEGGGSSDGGGA